MYMCIVVWKNTKENLAKHLLWINLTAAFRQQFKPIIVYGLFLYIWLKIVPDIVLRAMSSIYFDLDQRSVYILIIVPMINVYSLVWCSLFKDQFLPLCNDRH